MSQSMPSPEPQAQPSALPGVLPGVLPSVLPDAVLFAVTGARVRSLREIAGVTQTALADALGYHRSTICRWEAQPDKPIPATQVDPLLAFFRARYDVGEGRRIEIADLEERHQRQQGQQGHKRQQRQRHQTQRQRMH